MNRRNALAAMGASAAGLGALSSIGRGADNQPAHDPHSDARHKAAIACGECMAECAKAQKHCAERLGSGKTDYAKCLELCGDCAALCGACCTCCHGPMAATACQACAKACEACAGECESTGDESLAACAKSCRHCADVCKALIGHARP